jgi:hypothetical protein
MNDAETRATHIDIGAPIAMRVDRAALGRDAVNGNLLQRDTERLRR